MELVFRTPVGFFVYLVIIFLIFLVWLVLLCSRTRYPVIILRFDFQYIYGISIT